MSTRSLALATRRSLAWLPVAVGPALLLDIFASDSRRGILAFDFRIGLAAASQFVHGRPLYGPHSPVYYVYPPFYAESLTPFLLLPLGVACWIAALASAALVVAGLWSLGVRDVRALGVALCSAPVLHGCEVANASLLVFALLALAWRSPRAGVGLAVTLKLIAWPLLFWEATVRGIRSAASSALIVIGLVLGSWALIGFEGLAAYPHFLSTVSAGQGKVGYSVAAAFSGGRWIAAALTLAALARCFNRVRRGDVAGGLAYAIGAMLTATPYVYDNYFAAVFLPLALRRQRLSAAWLVPLLLWVNRGGGSLTLGDKGVAWAVFGGLIVWLGEGAPQLGIGLRAALGDARAGKRPGSTEAISPRGVRSKVELASRTASHVRSRPERRHGLDRALHSNRVLVMGRPVTSRSALRDELT